MAEFLLRHNLGDYPEDHAEAEERLKKERLTTEVPPLALAPLGIGAPEIAAAPQPPLPPLPPPQQDLGQMLQTQIDNSGQHLQGLQTQIDNLIQQVQILQTQMLPMTIGRRGGGWHGRQHQNRAQQNGDEDDEFVAVNRLGVDVSGSPTVTSPDDDMDGVDDDSAGAHQ